MFNKKIAGFTVLLLIAALLTAIALAGCGKTAEPVKAQKDYILIGRVNPVTGPLASFGTGTPQVEEKAIEAINKEGGIYIAEYGKKLPIKIIVADSESSPTKAAEAANKLILQDKVDIIMAAHTPDNVNPVTAAAERHKIPCITVDALSDAWLSGGPYTWAYHAFWKVNSLVDVYFDVWDKLPTNKKVGLIAPNDPDGMAIADMLKKKAPARGFTLVDPGRFPPTTKDYTAMINQFKQANVDIVMAMQNPPDFATAWKQMRQQGLTPKIMSAAKAVLFPSDIAALGDELGDGLTTEVWWSPMSNNKSSLTGQSSADIGKVWTDMTGKQPMATLGYKHASMEIVVDVLKRAQSLDRNKVREAIKATNIDTVVGHIQYNEQNLAETQVVGGQWVKGKTWPWEMSIISNNKMPMIPLAAESMKYVPGSR
jgi:branched-chain amino acid transport system substrate-binding protein